MGTAVQYRRGTTINHSTFIGLEGEITIDTTKNVPVVHDGLTPGGIPTAKASDVTALASTVNTKVDKVVGKQLSTEDYTTTEKDKLANLVVVPAGSGNAPVGTIITFASTTIPTGYLKANGALLSRTTYSALFAAIGTTFGIGDGSTTFALPDLRGYFPRGWDDGRGIDTSREFGSNQGDAYLNHSHTASETSAGAHTHTYSSIVDGGQSGWDSGFSGTERGQVNTSSSGAHTHTITVAASTTGATETRPKNIALLYCIKY